MHEVVDFAVSDIVPCLAGEQRDDAEFGQAEIDHCAAPQGAMALAAQFESALSDHRRRHRIGRRHRPLASGDQLQPLQQDRQTSRLVDEVDRTPFERGLLVTIVRERSQKDHRNADPGAAQPAQHIDPGQLGHAPIQQQNVGLPAVLQIGQGVVPIAEAGDLIAFVGEVEAERFAKQLIVIGQDKMRHLSGLRFAVFLDDRFETGPALFRVGRLTLEIIMQAAHAAAAHLHVEGKI